VLKSPKVLSDRWILRVAREKGLVVGFVRLEEDEDVVEEVDAF